MINLSLDPHDFVAAVEGFARGSHLRQHVWEEIVYKSIPQMSETDLDFFWFVFRRNLYDSYFYEIEGKTISRVGAEDYLHALAALHRGNRSYVNIKCATDGKKHKALCYTFQGQLRPLYVDGKNVLQRFGAFIPDVWVLKQTVIPIPHNDYVDESKEDWWTDLTIYNKEIER